MGEKPEWLPLNATARWEEKVFIVLDWLSRFHYSNAAIMMELLGLKHPANRAFFSKLAKKKLYLKQVDLTTLRRPVYMLTREGLSMLPPTPITARYNTDHRRISAANARHNLMVQRVALNRRHLLGDVMPERLINKTDKKIPDLMIRGQDTTVFEVELNYKSKPKIYIGLLDHFRSLRDGAYHKVEYVFLDAAMRDYYLALFNSTDWPVYKWDEKSRHYMLVPNAAFDPNNDAATRSAFSFTLESLPRD